MSKRTPLPFAAVVLAATLSCSVWAPSTPGRLPVSKTFSDPAGPGAAEFIEARFRSFLVNLSDNEVREVSRVIVEEATAHDLSWELVLAVIHTESGFHNFAVSHVGALGLMQIMPPTGRGLARELEIPWEGPETLFQPLTNVRMGTRYLAELHGRYGDWDKALAAYNWGPGRIDWRLRNGRTMPVEYANKVMAQVQSPAMP